MGPPPVLNIEKCKPWPGYFLVRPNTGEVVPLIAVDELPLGTDLVGVPRSLDLEDTIGMLNLGLQRSSGAFYQFVKREEKRCVKAGLPVRSKSSEEPTTAPKTVEVHMPAAAQASSPINTNAQNHNKSPVVFSTRTVPYSHCYPSTQRQICRHWCAHGICKWGQQCRYKHIMPMTLPGLHEVGLADWPLWYRGLNPGYFIGEKGRRRRVRTCASQVGYCSGVLGQSEREIGVRENGLRGRGGGGGRRVGAEGAVMMGEMVLERLRGLDKDVKKIAKGSREKHVSGNTALERVQAEEVKDWEEESSDCTEASEKIEVEEKKAKVAKEKLVDV